MNKQKAKFGYEIIECPVCHKNTFEYCSFSEYGWGIIEQHGYCKRCGYVIEQAYSPVFEGIQDIKRGFKLPNGQYVEKDIKRHKRIRRKLNVNNIEINPLWISKI